MSRPLAQDPAVLVSSESPEAGCQAIRPVFGWFLTRAIQAMASAWCRLSLDPLWGPNDKRGGCADFVRVDGTIRLR